MKNFFKEVLSTGIYLLVVLAFVYLVVNYVGQRTVVDGASMEPALSNMDNLWVDKLSYRFEDPERFDVIVFPFRYAEDTYYIKRIIGLPGETVWIDDEGSIYIDGVLLEENFGREIILPTNRNLAEQPILLGEDEYFVLGDNRNRSKDSRFPEVGNIRRDEIVGKAWIRLWPLHKFGVIKHGNE